MKFVMIKIINYLGTERKMILENNNKLKYPTHSVPLTNGIARVHKSYSLRPDVVAKIDNQSKQTSLSQSQIVEKILVEKFNL